MKKYGMVIGIILTFSLVNFAFAKETTKIGYIDFQRALTTSEAGKDAKAIIAKQYEKDQKILSEKQEELKKLKEELEKQGLLMKEDVRKEKERGYQTKFRDFQIYFKGAQENLKEEELKLTKPIIEELEKIAAEIGEKKGFTLILMKSLGIIYTNKSIDLTDETIEAYNNKYATEKK